MKKIVIALFIGCPVSLILFGNFVSHFIPNEDILNMDRNYEPYLKHANFIKNRSRIDTVICGDSRVARIFPDAFLKRNWFPFDWGICGLEPGDTAMQVEHALLYGNIRRFILGVSFEAMGDKDALSASVHLNQFPFTDPRITQLWGLRKIQNPERSVYKKLFLQTKTFINTFLRIAKLHIRTRLRYIFYKYIIHRDIPRMIDMYGNFEYSEVRRQIKNGTYDFQKCRDPLLYFNDNDKIFLSNKKLSAEAQQIYLRLLQELRSRKIPTLVFETLRIPSYQNMIDQEPLLKELNEQWRDFFRKESYGGIKFLEAKDVAPYYYFDEFIDAVHFLGEKTEKALSEKLASELEKLENSIHN